MGGPLAGTETPISPRRHRTPRAGGRRRNWLLAFVSDLASFEMAFLLFLFAGTYKASPYVAALSSRVDLTLATLVISVVVGVVVFVVSGARKILPPGNVRIYALIFGLLVAYACASYLIVAPGLPTARIKAQKLIVMVVWSMMAAAVLLRNEVRVARLLRLIVVYASVMAFEALARATAQGMRVHGAFGTDSYHALGGVAGVGFVICVGFLALRDGRADRLFYGPVAGMLLIAVLASGARHAVIGALGGSLFVGYAALKRRGAVASKARFVLAAGAIALVAYTLRVTVFESLSTGWSKGRLELAVSTLQGRDLHAFDRLVLWRIAVRMWLREPILGSGFGSFWHTTALNAYRQPHNIFLESLSELGLVGFFLTIAVLWQPGRELRRSAILSSPVAVIVGALYVFTVAVSMTSGDITDNRMIFTFGTLTLAGARWGRSSASGAVTDSQPRSSPGARGGRPRSAPAGRDGPLQSSPKSA